MMRYSALFRWVPGVVSGYPQRAGWRLLDLSSWPEGMPVLARGKGPTRVGSCRCSRNVMAGP